MTRRSRRTTFAELAVVFVLTMGARAAWGQACCVGGALVTPTRLAPHEDFAAGVQLRARSNPGGFDANGTYASATGSEHTVEQDVAFAARISRRLQAGALLPIVQTHRTLAAQSEWGGGVGDLSISARDDVVLEGERLHWPGLGLLAAVTLPTGRAADDATHPLATDATGAGTFDATIGANVEQSAGPLYAALTLWATHRFARTVAAPSDVRVRETFAPRFTALAVAGYVFESEASAGLYVTALEEGRATIDGVRTPGTGLRRTTVGAAGLLPFGDAVKLQGSVFWDVALDSWGRNEPAGFGASVAVVWAYL